jgi:hypothetical protein
MQKKARRQKQTANTKQLPKPNPALKALEGLVGDWEMELSNASFLPSPSDTVKGHVTFEWLENGGFLVMRQGDKPPSPPAASWVIGRDDSAENYSILYFDSRGVSRKYEMSFTEGVWKIWREAPGFWQRYEGQVSEDGNTITAHWENSPDGQKWEHDFDLTYTRVE